MTRISRTANHVAFTPISVGENPGRLPLVMEGATNTVTIQAVDRDLNPHTLSGPVTGYYWVGENREDVFPIDGALTAGTTSFDWEITDTDSAVSGNLSVVFVNNGLKTSPIQMRVEPDPHVSAGPTAVTTTLRSELYSLIGVSSPETNLGVFTGSTIAGDSTVKAALQALETAHESISLPTKETLDIDHLITLSGVAAGSDNLGTFTGTTILDNASNKAALQALETAVEAASAGSSWVGGEIVCYVAEDNHVYIGIKNGESDSLSIVVSGSLHTFSSSSLPMRAGNGFTQVSATSVSINDSSFSKIYITCTNSDTSVSIDAGGTSSFGDFYYDDNSDTVSTSSVTISNYLGPLRLKNTTEGAVYVGYNPFTEAETRILWTEAGAVGYETIAARLGV